MEGFYAAGVGVFAILAALWGLFISVFWIVFGLKAIKVHERLAKAVEEISRKQSQT